MTTPQEVLDLAAAEGAEFVDIRFTDVPGLQHHFTMPPARTGGRHLRGGTRLRRIFDPGLSDHRFVGHAAHPRPRNRAYRSVLCPQDARPRLRRQGPGHGRDVPQGPSWCRQASWRLHRQHRCGRHGLHRPRAGVLHFRRGVVLERRPLRRLRDCFGRGDLVERRPSAARWPAQPPATRCRTRWVTSHCRRWTPSRTYVRRWSSPSNPVA